jgi:pseudouridine-5'-phosphate glycosidase
VLETASVPVLGYRTDAFPGFYRRAAGLPVPWRVDAPAEAAAAWRAHTALGGGAGMVLAQPVPAADELPADVHDRLLAEGLALVAERGVTGKDVTPTLLAHFHEGSGGASLATNLALVVANAALAAQVAVASPGAGEGCGRRRAPPPSRGGRRRRGWPLPRRGRR